MWTNDAFYKFYIGKQYINADINNKSLNELKFGQVIIGKYAKKLYISQ